MTTTPEYTPMTPKWPDLSIQLVGQDGNAFGILARFDRELRRGVREGILTDEERQAARTQAMDGDYDHLLWFVQCMVDAS